MAFPADLAVVTLQAAFGADVTADPSTWAWTDVTSYWEASQPVTVRDGRSEGATQAEASEATITLDATDGAMMPEDARSPYWPDVDVGTPVWMVINAGAGDYDLVAGFISGLVPSWPQRSRYCCWVTITVRGLLDRLGRGQSPLLVPLQRAILADTPVAYWPLSDGEDSTQAGSGLVSGTPMTVTGTPDWAEADGPAGAPDRYVTVRSDDTQLGTLSAPVVMADGDEWTVECWALAPTVSTGGHAALFEVTTSHPTYPTWTVYVDEPGTVTLTVSSPIHSSTNMPLAALTNTWTYVRVHAYPDGYGGMNAVLTVNGTSSLGGFSGLPGAIRRVSTTSPWMEWWYGSGGVASVSLAHLAAYAGEPSSHYQAGLGFAGEAASTRISRLCTEEGVPVTVTAGDSEPMGAQPSATFLNLLRECEAADGGRLGEDGFALAYRPRSSLYAQTPVLDLDGALTPVCAPFEPRRDLSKLRNEWKITRSNGSSAVYADTDNQERRGRLDDSATINVATDGVLLNHAGWRVGVGTVRGLRYPGLSVDLGRHPEVIATWQDLALGDRIQASNLIHQHPLDPIDQIIEGRSQTLTGRTRWTATMVTSPASPYEVGIYDDAGSRYDTAGSELGVGVDADDTTWSIATTTGPVWSTTATPYDLMAGGERVTVTAMVGTSSPQTATVVRAVNGVTKSHAAGTAVRLAAPVRYGL